MEGKRNLAGIPVVVSEVIPDDEIWLVGPRVKQTGEAELVIIGKTVNLKRLVAGLDKEEG